MTLEGVFRISFNRHGAAPLVWSVAPLDGNGNPIMDIAVRAIGLDRVKVATMYAPKATSDDEDGQPSAYLVAAGTLTVDESGVALLTGPAHVPCTDETCIGYGNDCVHFKAGGVP